MGRPESDVKYHGWKDFVNKNKDKVRGATLVKSEK